jgi:hypothetical protein
MKVWFEHGTATRASIGQLHARAQENDSQASTYMCVPDKGVYQTLVRHDITIHVHANCQSLMMRRVPKLSAWISHGGATSTMQDSVMSNKCGSNESRSDTFIALRCFHSLKKGIACEETSLYRNQTLYDWQRSPSTRLKQLEENNWCLPWHAHTHTDARVRPRIGSLRRAPQPVKDWSELQDATHRTHMGNKHVARRNAQWSLNRNDWGM